MKDYHDLYLKCESLMSGYVLEKFRNNSFKNYGLCPRHCLREPGLKWNATLEITKIDLEFITGPSMFIFFEKSFSGGISYNSNRYNTASTKYLKYYDLKQESKHIIYLDAYNLYGYAMAKFLPTSVFEWNDPAEFEVNKYTSNSWKVCILKVDLECQKELYKLDQDYPLP